MRSRAGARNLGRSGRTLVAGLASLAMLGAAPGWVSVASAQARGDGANSQDVAGRVLALIREANDLFSAGQYHEAQVKYTEAYELYPDPAILVRLGKTAEKQGQEEKALEYYKEFIRLLPDDPASVEVSAAIARLEQVDAAELSVVSDPAGGEIFLNDDAETVQGTTPATLTLAPGAYTVRVTLEGHEAASKQVELVAGAKDEVTLGLKKAAVPEPIAQPTPVEPAQPAASDSMHLDIYGWSALGLGVATLATSGVFYSMALSGEDDVNSYDKRKTGASREELQRMKDDVNSDYDITLVTGIIGGVFAAAGAGLLTYHYLTVREDRNPPAIAWELGAGADTERAWVGIHGSF